ncbi:MAG: MFS transporter, partial [Deltaproteobacteria bacterium]|nr:MFS transporter [Deltaproteobacteria bacterium]
MVPRVQAQTSRAATLAVIVAALGYFVDIYDLILFGMVRTASLKDLGVVGKAALTSEGIYLLNMQMGGMLVGGVLWGVLGDKKGRLSVLFGSIAMYSLANLANGFPFDWPTTVGMSHIDAYALCRLVAGIGLAGELGAGITLVSELMGKHNRGVGTTLVAALGVSGGVVAGLIGGAFPGVGVHWTTAYYIGGFMGLALLALRIGVVESGMFKSVLEKKQVSRGNFFRLFTSRKRFLRYLAIICVGVPVWYVIAILFVFANELGGALGLVPEPSPARSLFFCYGGCALGGVAAGMLSQRLQSRKRALGIFLGLSAVMCTLYFLLGGISSTVFYTLCCLGGAASGYWAVFVSTAAELFGTNLRATVTTTVPNFVRGSAVLLTTGFQALTPSSGLIGAAIIVGVFAFAVAAFGLLSLKETFGVDLDFHETDDDAEPPVPKATATSA